jgi:hypothetical protein
MNRREFIGLSALGIAGASLIYPYISSGANKDWNPNEPYKTTGETIRIQPVLLYQLYQRREATSWRPWGGLHTEADVESEANRIASELENLAKKAYFPIHILPLVKVKSMQEAANLEKSSGYDVPIIYAASGGGNMLEACVSDKRDNLIFLRHRSGPIYLWYEIIHNRFLRKGGREFELDTYRNPAGMDIHDVVVDDYDELLYKLKALYGVKNFIGKRIVALGGSGGWCCPLAPQVSRDKFKLDIQEVNYSELESRIKSARKDQSRVRRAEKCTQKYLSISDTNLHTDKQFLVNAFLLYDIFKDLLIEAKTNVFTIKECMTTVIPMSETTACLPLSLLNDEGLVAFCESDFNVIPSGILLHYLSGKPVFLNDPTYPHKGIVTAAHCTAPRRMDGQDYALAKVVTHYESDYGATPKVELPIGTKITMICPDSGQIEWLGFTGTIEQNPFYDICRSQYDIKIEGDWEKLLRDHRGFHWMMACGDYMKEMAYACRKMGLNWVNISQV